MPLMCCFSQRGQQQIFDDNSRVAGLTMHNPGGDLSARKIDH